MVIAQKAAPIFGHQGAVGLQAIHYDVAGSIFLLEGYDSFVEFEWTYHCFTAMPGELHSIGCLSFNVSTYEIFKHSIAHVMTLIVGIEFIFLKIIAVAARHVAHSAGRFSHNIKRLLKDVEL